MKRIANNIQKDSQSKKSATIQNFAQGNHSLRNANLGTIYSEQEINDAIIDTFRMPIHQQQAFIQSISAKQIVSRNIKDAKKQGLELYKRQTLKTNQERIDFFKTVSISEFHKADTEIQVYLSLPQELKTAFKKQEIRTYEIGYLINKHKKELSELKTKNSDNTKLFKQLQLTHKQEHKELEATHEKDKIKLRALLEYQAQLEAHNILDNTPPNIIIGTKTDPNTRYKTDNA